MITATIEPASVRAFEHALSSTLSSVWQKEAEKLVGGIKNNISGFAKTTELQESIIMQPPQQSTTEFEMVIDIMAPQAEMLENGVPGGKGKAMYIGPGSQHSALLAWVEKQPNAEQLKRKRWINVYKKEHAAHHFVANAIEKQITQNPEAFADSVAQALAAAMAGGI